MNKRRTLSRGLLVAGLVGALAACTVEPPLTAIPTAPPTRAPASATPPPDGTPTPSPTATPSATPAGPFEPRVEVVASHLEIPWALAFAPDGRLFFTERPGRLRVIVGGQLRPEPVAVLPVGPVGEGGLLGLALDPHFSENGYLYVYYTYQEAGGLQNRISRLTLQGEHVGAETVLLEGIPGARNHDGGQLRFGPDGKLYATTGDAGQSGLAQDLGSLAGKILRLNPDGSIPSDNPFPGSYVYSFGHRNPQGIDWHPLTGQLFATEHGPSGEFGLCCRDEVNLILSGGNYGWPEVTLAPGDPRFLDPILHSGADRTWAPAGASFYHGEVLWPWQGSLFFGALRGQHLHRVVLGGADGGQVLDEEVLFQGELGRLRAVLQGPDGLLYFTTSNHDGRGAPAPDDDRILRIVPA